MSFSDYMAGLRDGISIGVNIGYRKGFEDGACSGYLTGYNQGYKDASLGLPYRANEHLLGYKPVIPELPKYEPPVIDLTPRYEIPKFEPLLPKNDLFDSNKRFGW